MAGGGGESSCNGLNMKYPHRIKCWNLGAQLVSAVLECLENFRRRGLA